MKKVLFVLSFSILVGLVGCAAFMKYGQFYSQAQKDYNAGKYDAAVYNCVSSLKENPSYEKAIMLLTEVLPIAYQEHQEAIKKFREKKDWDNVVAEYDAIIKIVAAIKGFGGALRGKFQTIDVEKEREEAANLAAKAHYAQGEVYMKGGKNKEAAVEFRKTLEYRPDSEAAKKNYEKTRAAAIKRIAIMPFENLSGKREYGNIEVLLADKVISGAMDKNPEFIEFVTRDYLNQLLKEQKIGMTGLIDESSAAEMGKVLGVHSFVFGKINTIVVNYPSEKTTTEKREASYKDLKTGVVTNHTATVTIYSKEGKAEIQATFQIVDVKTGTIAKSSSISAQAISTAKWATAYGDAKALKSNDQYLLEGNQDVDPPESLVNKAIDSLGRDLSGKLFEHFK